LGAVASGYTLPGFAVGLAAYALMIAEPPPW
jgi:hypothetical protein